MHGVRGSRGGHGQRVWRRDGLGGWVEFACRSNVTRGRQVETRGQLPSAGASGSASDNEIGVPPIWAEAMRNDGVPSTAGDAGVVGVGASAAPGLGRLLPLFGAAFFKAGVAACGVLEAWTWRAAAMASSPARSSSVSPFRDSAERGVVGSGCMCATVAAGAYRRRG